MSDGEFDDYGRPLKKKIKKSKVNVSQNENNTSEENILVTLTKKEKKEKKEKREKKEKKNREKIESSDASEDESKSSTVIVDSVLLKKEKKQTLNGFDIPSSRKRKFVDESDSEEMLHSVDKVDKKHKKKTDKLKNKDESVDHSDMDDEIVSKKSKKIKYDDVCEVGVEDFVEEKKEKKEKKDKKDKKEKKDKKDKKDVDGGVSLGKAIQMPLPVPIEDTIEKSTNVYSDGEEYDDYGRKKKKKTKTPKKSIADSIQVDSTETKTPKKSRTDSSLSEPSQSSKLRIVSSEMSSVSSNTSLSDDVSDENLVVEKIEKKEKKDKKEKKEKDKKEKKEKKDKEKKEKKEKRDSSEDDFVAENTNMMDDVVTDSDSTNSFNNKSTNASKINDVPTEQTEEFDDYGAKRKKSKKTKTKEDDNQSNTSISNSVDSSVSSILSTPSLPLENSSILNLTEKEKTSNFVPIPQFPLLLHDDPTVLGVMSEYEGETTSIFNPCSHTDNSGSEHCEQCMQNDRVLDSHKLPSICSCHRFQPQYSSYHYNQLGTVPSSVNVLEVMHKAKSSETFAESFVEKFITNHQHSSGKLRLHPPVPIKDKFNSGDFKFKNFKLKYTRDPAWTVAADVLLGDAEEWAM